MKPEDIKKLKIALILALLFILIKSLSEIGAVGSSKALVTSLVVGLPFLLLVYWIYGRAENLAETTKRSIAYISVPISLGLWRWLHMVSKYYEAILALVLCYILILTIYIERKKERAACADIGDNKG